MQKGNVEMSNYENAIECAGFLAGLVIAEEILGGATSGLVNIGLACLAERFETIGGEG